MTDTLKTVLVNALNASKLRWDDPRYTNDLGSPASVDFFLRKDGTTITALAEDNHYFSDLDSTVIETAIRDHVLNREKVRCALLTSLADLDVGFDNQGFELTRYFHDEDGSLFIGCDPFDESDGPVKEAFTTGLIPVDDLIDRLIEGLTL